MQEQGLTTLISLGLARETAQRLLAARDELDVAAIIRTEARRRTCADGSTVVFKRGKRVAYVEEDAIGPLWKGQDFPIEACISGWAVTHKRTVVIPNIYVDDRIPHAAYQPTFVNSLMMAPVRPEAPIAAIGAYWSSQHRATMDEVRALEAVAKAAAIALERFIPSGMTELRAAC